MRKKKLGITLCLSATLLFGTVLNVCAGSDTYRSNEIIVGYGSSVTATSGYAYTSIAGGGTGTTSGICSCRDSRFYSGCNVGDALSKDFCPEIVKQEPDRPIVQAAAYSYSRKLF